MGVTREEPPRRAAPLLSASVKVNSGAEGERARSRGGLDEDKGREVEMDGWRERKEV